MPSNKNIPDVSKASDLLSWLEKEKKNFSVKAPIDVKGILKVLGVNLEYYIDFDDTVGSITKKNSSYTIKINEMQNGYEPRHRFTLAHELGHLFRHLKDSAPTSFMDTQQTMSRKESYWDIKESEANAFAAQLLMPKNLILKEGKVILKRLKAETGRDSVNADDFIDKMTVKFNVSTPAMTYRLKSLGILNR